MSIDIYIAARLGPLLVLHIRLWCVRVLTACICIYECMGERGRECVCVLECACASKYICININICIHTYVYIIIYIYI